MAYDQRKRYLAIVKEDTYNTDPIGSGPPSGVQWIKVSDPVTHITADTVADDAAGAWPSGFRNLANARSYNHSGFVELTTLKPDDSSARPRGAAVLSMLGFTFAFTNPSTPKILTATLSPDNADSCTIWDYQIHTPSGGLTASHWLDKITGARGRGVLVFRNGKLGVTYEAQGAAGSRNNGASRPTDAPFVDTEGAYRQPFAFAQATVTLQDEDGGNVASTLLKDFTLDLGQDISAEYTAGNSGNPIGVNRLMGPRTGTMRLFAVSRATSDPVGVLLANKAYVCTMTFADPADSDITLSISFAFSPRSVAKAVDGDRIYWDIEFSTVYTTDGTAYGRTPARDLALIWTDATP